MTRAPRLIDGRGGVSTLGTPSLASHLMAPRFDAEIEQVSSREVSYLCLALIRRWLPGWSIRLEPRDPSVVVTRISAGRASEIILGSLLRYVPP